MTFSPVGVETSVASIAPPGPVICARGPLRALMIVMVNARSSDAVTAYGAPSFHPPTVYELNEQLSACADASVAGGGGALRPADAAGGPGAPAGLGRRSLPERVGPRQLLPQP